MGKPLVSPAGPYEDEEMERFIAENHAYIAAKLEEAQTALERGEVRPMPPLAELLAEARRHHAAKVQSR